MEVFRIEHRESQNGVFRAGPITDAWDANDIAMPSPNSEERIYAFITLHEKTARFAYLSCVSIQRWFDTENLAQLDTAGFHISVFDVSNDYRISAFSLEQVVFLPSEAQWLRFMSLIDL